MSVEQEVLIIGKKLTQMVEGEKSEDNAPELIDILAKLPMSFDILDKTHIGKTLNNLRKKTSDEALRKRLKTLIKDWKSLVDAKTPSKPEPISRTASTNSTTRTSQDDGSATPKNRNLPSTVAQFSGVFPPKHLEGDEVRCKSAQMLLSALQSGAMPDGTMDPEQLAVKIEQKLYDVHRGVTDKYKSALRSRVFNLRDKKNVALRENVLCGVVTPEKFAVMTSEEMASDEIKQQREKFAKEAILEHQMSVQGGTPSDMFKCGKCGKKNCTYSQLQTRSSDEPMTTFVFCMECGNRWKFC